LKHPQWARDQISHATDGRTDGFERVEKPDRIPKSIVGDFSHLFLAALGSDDGRHAWFRGRAGSASPTPAAAPTEKTDRISESIVSGNLGDVRHFVHVTSKGVLDHHDRSGLVSEFWDSAFLNLLDRTNTSGLRNEEMPGRSSPPQRRRRAPVVTGAAGGAHTPHELHPRVSGPRAV
jgi:hypothetical protein